MLVFDDKYHVKARQDSGHEINVVLPLCVIPATKHRVSGSQHGASRVQRGGDASLRDGQLLFCLIEEEKKVFLLVEGLAITLAIEIVCCSMAS